ncbi:hypothetical protein ACTA71_010926 [Dictyostelium dimigraforme]
MVAEHIRKNNFSIDTPPITFKFSIDADRVSSNQHHIVLGYITELYLPQIITKIPTRFYSVIEFIKIHKLKRFLFDSTGSNKNWSYKRFDNNNKLVNQITPIIPENKMKDHQVNADYALDQFHKPFFEWNYKAINYDLNRSFAF